MLRVVDCCSDDSFFLEDSSLSTEELVIEKSPCSWWPAWLRPFSPIARFRWSASSRKRSAGSNYLWMMEVAVLNWDLKSSRHFSVIFPWFLPPDKPELGPQTGSSASCSVCAVRWTVGPYIDSPEPFQIMSNQLESPQVDSSTAREWSVRTRRTSAYFWASWRRRNKPGTAGTQMNWESFSSPFPLNSNGQH